MDNHNIEPDENEEDDEIWETPSYMGDDGVYHLGKLKNPPTNLMGEHLSIKLYLQERALRTVNDMSASERKSFVDRPIPEKSSVWDDQVTEEINSREDYETIRTPTVSDEVYEQQQELEHKGAKLFAESASNILSTSSDSFMSSIRPMMEAQSTALAKAMAPMMEAQSTALAKAMAPALESINRQWRESTASLFSSGALRNLLSIHNPASRGKILKGLIIPFSDINSRYSISGDHTNEFVLKDTALASMSDKKLDELITESRSLLAEKIKRLSASAKVGQWSSINLAYLAKQYETENLIAAQYISVAYIETCSESLWTKDEKPWRTSEFTGILSANALNRTDYSLKDWDRRLREYIKPQIEEYGVRGVRVALSLCIVMANTASLEALDIPTERIPSRHGTSHVGGSYISDYNAIALGWILFILLQWVEESPDLVLGN